MWSLFSNSLGNSYSSTALVKAIACYCNRICYGNAFNKTARFYHCDVYIVNEVEVKKVEFH